MTESKLTPRQQDFIRHYFECGRNASEAAIRAGYSPKTAKEQGARLLTFVNISAAISEREERAKVEHDVSFKSIVDELKMVAFGRAGNLMEWDAHSMTFVPKAEMKDADRAFVDTITCTPNEHGTTLKMTTLARDKVKALELLARLLGFDRDQAIESETERALRAAIMELDNT